MRTVLALAAALLLSSATALAATRSRVCLNGWWQFQPADAMQAVPTDGGWSDQRILVPSEWTVIHSDWDAYDVFGYPKAWREAAHAWYRRSFRPTAAMAGKRLWLVFDAISFRAEVHVNGRAMCVHEGSFTPFRFDVTEAVQFDRDNELLVAVSGPSAAWKEGKFRWPMGSWWGWHQAGIWQDVWLEALAAVRTEEVFVITSVRQGSIGVQLTAVNESNTDESIRITAQPAAVHGDARGPRMVSETIALAAGERRTVTLTAPWRNPRLWSPEDPFLYDLEVTTECHDGDRWQADDRSHTRFGFREFWIDGERFMLNGVPINLRGDSWHYFGSTMQTRGYVETWYRMAKEAGINVIRPHAMPYPPVFYDVADEMGMFIVDESPVYGSGGNIATTSPEFWEHSRQMVHDWVVRDRNHPSVVLWSASNEILWGGRGAARDDLFSLQAVIHEVDPTRPVYFEGEGDLGGLADIHGLHYPHGLGAHWLLPDAAHEYVDDPDSITHRGKPVYIGEYGAMYYGTPDQMCALGGDDTYADFDGLLRAHAAEIRFRQVAYRQGGVDGITPWNTVWYSLYPLPFDDAAQSYADMTAPGAKPLVIHKYAATLNPGNQKGLPEWRANPVYHAIRWANRPVAEFVRERDHNFFAGETVTRTVTVFNDTATTANLRLHWDMRPAAEADNEGETVLTLGPAEHRTFTAELHMPEVEWKQTRLWRREPYQDGTRLYMTSSRYHVYPRSLCTAPIDTHQARFLLYDTTGTTRTILDRLGVPCNSIDAPPGPGATEVLIIGSGSPPPKHWRQPLADFAERGGTVLAFEQNAGLDWLPARIRLSDRAATITFAQAPEHPVLEGLEPGGLKRGRGLGGVVDGDFSYWRGDHVVARRLFHRPRRGSAVSLIDAGGEGGLQWSALIEMRRGRGRYLLCQALVTEKFGKDPIATRLLRNLLAYAAQRPPRRQTFMRIGAPGEGSLSEALDRLGLGAGGATLRGRAPDVLAVDGSQGDEIERALEQVGRTALVDRDTRVIIIGGTPESVRALSRLVGREIKLVPHAASHVCKVEADPLLARVLTGINNHDLYWVGRGERKIMDYAIDLDGLTESVPLINTSSADWDRFVAWPEQTKYAGQMLALDERGYRPFCAMAWFRGQGIDDVIMCTLNLARWSEEPKAQRILSALLTNLGLTLEPDGEIEREISPEKWTAAASHASGAARLAFDRSDSTRWTTMEPQAAGMWFRLDLSRAETFDRIVLDTIGSPNDYPRAFSIETSADGETWQPLLSRDRVEAEPDPTLLDVRFPATTARYVRINQSGSSPHWWWSIYELHLLRPKAITPP